MQEERALTVSVDIRLSFELESSDSNAPAYRRSRTDNAEVEPIPHSNRDNFDIAAESAIADLRAHLARYSGGRVVSLKRTDKTV
jgi:hypothetical protein